MEKRGRGRPKGATKAATLVRDAYQSAVMATAERAKQGDRHAQELILWTLAGQRADGPFSPWANTSGEWERR